MSFGRKNIRMTVQQQWIENNNRQPDMYLHRNIRALRKKLSLSQEELAALVGLNRGNIASYENGAAEPKICNLFKLSQVFGVSVIDLAHRDLSQNGLHHDSGPIPTSVTLHDPEMLNQFRERVEEISRVIHSLYTCFQFKLKSFPEPSPEVQALQVHFEQMREASQALIDDHLALLGFMERP